MSCMLSSLCACRIRIMASSPRGRRDGTTETSPIAHSLGARAASFLTEQRPGACSAGHPHVSASASALPLFPPPPRHAMSASDGRPRGSTSRAIGLAFPSCAKERRQPGVRLHRGRPRTYLGTVHGQRPPRHRALRVPRGTPQWPKRLGAPPCDVQTSADAYFPTPIGKRC